MPSVGLICWSTLATYEREGMGASVEGFPFENLLENVIKEKCPDLLNQVLTELQKYIENRKICFLSLMILIKIWMPLVWIKNKSLMSVTENFFDTKLCWKLSLFEAEMRLTKIQTDCTRK